MIANRTTTVPAAKTVGEIQSMLAGMHATALMIDYHDGEPSAIAFSLVRNGHPISFKLPCNWQGVYRALQREKIPRRLMTHEHAKRVAWRVVRDWLRAQLSLIEAGATAVEVVMLPWAITRDGSTVADRVLSGSAGLLALPAPRDESEAPK